MDPEDFRQLVREGNIGRIESAWMAALEADDLKPSAMAACAPCLAELREIGRKELAETLAWTGIEGVSGRFDPDQAVAAAGPLLLAVGESESLRGQVSELYRAAYGDREGFEALLTEAGLPKGRPVRRALRTLDVCMAIAEGDYLTARDDPGAARVEKIDRDDWRFTITSDDGTEMLGAVHLADRYQPAAEDDFTVQVQFNRDGLLKRLDSDPVSILTDLCRQRDNKIDSDDLLELLVPELMDEARFKKWWLKARSALKGVPFLQLSGRSPYVVTFIDRPITFEDILRREFDKQREPLAKLACIEQYTKDCAAADQAPSADALAHCHDALVRRAEHVTEVNKPDAVLHWTVACRTGEMAKNGGASSGLAALLRDAKDLRPMLDMIPDDELKMLVLDALAEARPSDWQDRSFELLPYLPAAVCDRVAARLVEAGRTPSDFAPAVQRVLGSPVECFEGLLWLWDGPSTPEIVGDVAHVAILTRVLRALDESRREEVASKERAKTMATRARSALSARKYERFIQCLESIEAGMANALTTQVSQLDVLGRAVKENLLGLILDHFPSYEMQPRQAPWEREDVLFVTEEGFSRKRAEIDHHVNVTMKENAKAIGAAAEKGDLSENSEYKFALEERDLLRARLLQMNSEMAMARVINPDEVPEDAVGIGTRAVFERVDDGERYELAFLGSWDADPEKGCLNYKSPLAQQLMGMKVGETVEFDHAGRTGTYRLKELHNALKHEA